VPSVVICQLRRSCRSENYVRADSPRSGRISASTGAMFARRIRTMGIRDRPTSPRSPWQNPYVDWKAPGATVLDLVLMFGARHRGGS
jgi:hypothetical protein